MSLLPLPDAQARLIDRVEALGTETVSLDDAHDRVLAAPVRAYRDQPPSPLSAMDGYALREADLEKGRFRIIGEAPAGSPFEGRVGEGDTVRIFTGAVVPEGADRVVMQEIMRRESDTAILTETPGGSAFIRPAGLDFTQGDELVSPGTVIGPAAIALAAAANSAELTVHRRPSVAIVSSGNELIAPGGTPTASQIIDAASHGVAALVRRWGGGEIRRVHLPDDADEVVRTARDLFDSADVVVTIGGASVGDHDLLRAGFAEAGAELHFAGVAVRPGKPFWHARRGGTLIAGLPGNPASALVTARLLLAPLLGRLSGAGEAPYLTCGTAHLSDDLPSPGRRETWHRARCRDGVIEVDRREDSSLLTPFAGANVLLRQSADQDLSKGETVSYLPLVDPLRS